jgi:MoxR-like ATPase
LRDAVNVALFLGQPLLVTGEPGTGKTQLAYSVAYELGLGQPLVFNSKTTSTATDLFYTYDALGHFHASRFEQFASHASSFVRYQALGLAILRSCGYEPSSSGSPRKSRVPCRSVVLIDEIDKAPRDFVNDILIETEGLTFEVRETGESFSANPDERPVVILTSNSERQLPDAFLRRCVYCHIAFPDLHELRVIVKNRLGVGSSDDSDLVDSAIRRFDDIRRLNLSKPPATAELLSWIRVLEHFGLNPDASSANDGDKAKLSASLSALAKNPEDRRAIERLLFD